MAFPAMLSELYDAFRRKVGADEPPARAAAKAVVVEDTRFRSIDGKLDALSRTTDQRFDALSQRFDVLSSVIDQRFDALSHAMDQWFDALSRMIDQRFATVDQRFAAMDVCLARLRTKTATEFRYLRWCSVIVIACSAW